MTAVVVGADRDALQIMLFHSGKVTQHRDERTVQQRSDLETVEAFLAKEQLSWSAVQRFGLVVLPHGKTTVRVLKTILATTAWYYDRPLVEIPCERLDELGIDEARQLLEAAGNSFDDRVLNAGQ